MNKKIKVVILVSIILSMLQGCREIITEHKEIHNNTNRISKDIEEKISVSKKELMVQEKELTIQEKELNDISLEIVPLAEKPAMFSIPIPTATGINVKKNERAEIDYSNTKDGYVMIKYLNDTDKKLKVIVKGPSTSYTYTLKSKGYYEIYPLSDGNGDYTIGVYEQASGNKYATVLTLTQTIQLIDEFAPFLRPNQYVNYDNNSEAVKVAADIIMNSDNIIDKISVIYNYIINNITYDKELANTVKSGYIPDIDVVLKKGKGICFDYAALMAAMLRSQGIPTKLVVGYTGEIYHAWIDTYSNETGWINNIIYFDGKGWRLMDPTFASSGQQSAEVMKYISNVKNYTTKYLY